MKRAFTMLELVFVIVVIGILSIFIAPKLQNDRLNELGHQIISDLRYTQHLAMQDNKFDQNDEEWYKARWQLLFQTEASSGDIYYTIWSNRTPYTNTSPQITEIAIDQTSKRRMTGRPSYTTSNIDAMNLTEEYDIKSFTLSFGNQRLYFDYLGRAYAPNTAFTIAGSRFDGLLPTDCNLTLTNSDDENITITISAETGYAYIAN